MLTFAIQHGPTALCTWDVEIGRATFHPSTSRQGKLLVLEETEKITFVLNPATEGLEYSIYIGDVPLSDITPAIDDVGGVSLGGKLFWRELAYFESARGKTKIVLKLQEEHATQGKGKALFEAEVYVIPSKLGEDRYQNMADDLEKTSRALLVDLYGKSKQTHDLRYAKEGKAFNSPEQELSLIEIVLSGLGPILNEIGQRPASKIQNVAHQHKYWGGERIGPMAAAWACRRSLNLLTAERPLLIRRTKRVESFDIPEHRTIRAFLDILIRRATYCASVAKRHIGAITSEQHLRHIRLGNGPTIYESHDLPKIQKLQNFVRKAGRCISLARAMTSLSYLRDMPPELVAIRAGAFQRSPEYKIVLRIIRQFLLANAIWYKGDGMSAVTKLTSRLFEQWCYLKTVDAFRSCGLDLREWDDALRQNLMSRFILDFDRGLAFEGALGSDLRLRLRYEPWILSEESAIETGETLCRGSMKDTAWCPDIMIECLRKDGPNWSPVYAIVLDSKYTAKIQDQHWHTTAKYLEIRNTQTKRQVVRQLWLITPSDRPSIRSEDPAVSFNHNGPSCPSDESVRFHMKVEPSPFVAETEASSKRHNTFMEFAQGTISFLRREFIGTSTDTPET